MQNFHEDFKLFTNYAHIDTKIIMRGRRRRKLQNNGETPNQSILSPTEGKH